MKFISKVKVKIEKCGRVHQESKIGNPREASRIAYEFIDCSDREILGVMCLNTKNNVINISMVSMGSLNSSIAHPREIFKTAVLSNSASIILFHNHPSGYLTPSKEDRETTLRVKEGGKLLGIELLDSLIIGNDIEDGCFSFKESGVI